VFVEIAGNHKRTLIKATELTFEIMPVNKMKAEKT
jgi:hypothetical protein